MHVASCVECLYLEGQRGARDENLREFVPAVNVVRVVRFALAVSRQLVECLGPSAGAWCRASHPGTR